MNEKGYNIVEMAAMGLKMIKNWVLNPKTSRMHFNAEFILIKNIRNSFIKKDHHLSSK